MRFFGLAKTMDSLEDLDDHAINLSIQGCASLRVRNEVRLQ